LIARFHSDPKRLNHAKLSQIVLELIAFTFLKTAKPGNSVQAPRRCVPLGTTMNHLNLTLEE